MSAFTSDRSRPPDPAILDRLRHIVGPRGILDGEGDREPYLIEPRGLFRGRTPLVVRPASTAETAAIISVCAEAGQPIVPQGGNTGLVGGSIPFEEGREIVLSTARMNRIRNLDSVNHTIAVDAGCILADIQRAASDADRLFPLSYGSEGTCQIGGALSTNGGGVAVLRYGNARDLCLGLEAVLPNGRVLDMMRELRKNNTGYDLKHLFIGAEGTLGVITGAILKLFPKPRDTATALIGLPDLKAAGDLFIRARAASADAVTTFEIMPRLGLEFAFAHVEGCVDPLAEPHPWYVLAEFSGSDAEPGLDGTSPMRAVMNGLLEAAYEAGLAADAALADSERQRAGLWRLREGIVDGQKFEGGSIKHDVAVPVSRVVEFIERATGLLADRFPGARPIPFGHFGDGNIHYNVSQPPGMDRAAYLDRWDAMNRVVHDLAHEMNGSISAEHGIGRLKRGALPRYKGEVELDLMRRVKAAIDPHGIMNPGKVI